MLSYLIILQLASVSLIGALEPSPIVPESCKRPDTSAAATLDRVCKDCYDLHREDVVYDLCRKDCFNNEKFNSCVEVLTIKDEQTREDLKRKIVYLNGGGTMAADINV